jgi:hypothetical protein
VIKSELTLTLVARKETCVERRLLVFIDMVAPLLNLKDSGEQESKKKKKPFSRPRKDGDGTAVARVVAKKPKEQKQPVVVQPDAPEKKSQKRKYGCRAIANPPNHVTLSQKEGKVQGKTQS